MLRIFILLMLPAVVYAQNAPVPFQDGEELNYDIHYKYGLVMVKAGSARYAVNTITFNNQPSYRTTLNFKTSSFFDKIYKIRDTLTSYVNDPKLVPLYHYRVLNEGDTHFTEKLFVRKHSSTYSEVRVIREKNKEVKLDTILNANNLGYDILNVFVFARTLDYPKLETGRSFRITTFVGKRKSNIIVRYAGQAVIDKGNNVKYRAQKLNVDIADEVFNASKNSMEIWISDDKNRIPIKIKAKLKIGSAEADLASYKNLKNPFDAEVKIPVHK